MAFHIGKNCRIHPSVQIDVREGFLGDNALVLEGAKIEGERVEIGRESYIDRFAVIGGGSCHDPEAFLTAGDWFHLGAQAQVNIARGVRVGHELGCGIESKIFTHGAWLDSINLGAPAEWGGVEIGDAVWMPNAWVNPGVRIGNQVIVGVRSLVNRDLPSGCFAAGAPVKIINENRLPALLSEAEQTARLNEVIRVARLRLSKSEPTADASEVRLDLPQLISGETIFDLKQKTIRGPATAWTLMLKDQLRRNGVRFRFKTENDLFVPWRQSVHEV